MKHNIPDPVFLSAPKTANLCGVSRNTICCWIRDGKLPSYTTAGGKYLIRPTDLRKFMTDNQMFVPPTLEQIAAEEEARERGQAVQVVPPAAEEATVSDEPSVLIVEDDPNARMLAVRTIEKLNVPVLEAENGYEAMHMLTKHPEISLVLLDLVMPGKDGVQTYQEIREINETLPVIIVTGHPPESYESFGPKVPDLVITKPYQPSKLLSASNMFMQNMQNTNGV